MRRIVVLVLLAVVVIAAATVADYPGRVDITWQGWEIDTSVGVLIAALVIVALALWLLFTLAGSMMRLPGRFRRNRRERRRRAGEVALTRGMVALAAGDADAAKRYAGRAEALLAHSPLTLLLAAQAAQLAGDTVTARGRYAALLDEKDGEFLALRGLIGQALQAGDSDEALRLSRRAIGLRPNAEWVFATLFALEAEAGRWEAARDVLDGATRRHLLPEARAAHHRGVLLYQLSLAAEAAGERRRALSLAASAVAAAPDLIPAAVRHARSADCRGQAPRGPPGGRARLAGGAASRIGAGLGRTRRRCPGAGTGHLVRKIVGAQSRCGRKPCRRRRGGAGGAALGRGAPPSRAGGDRRDRWAVAPVVPAMGAARRGRASASRRRTRLA